VIGDCCSGHHPDRRGVAFRVVALSRRRPCGGGSKVSRRLKPCAGVSNEANAANLCSLSGASPPYPQYLQELSGVDTRAGYNAECNAPPTRPSSDQKICKCSFAIFSWEAVNQFSRLIYGAGFVNVRALSVCFCRLHQPLKNNHHEKSSYHS
jgi:hypothetical protein